MTLLGELYAHGFGVGRNDKKAAEWYRLAADRGDREAMFALGVFHLSGRAGAVNREQAAKLLAAAAKLGQLSAAYDLGLLYLEASCSRRISRAPPSCSAAPRRPAIRRRNTRSRSTRTAVASPRTNEAARLLAAAAAAQHVDAQVEYAIALFNGTGVARNEPVAAELLKKAARRGNPVAQNRLANILAIGRGLKADAVEAIKWHIVAKAGGVSDLPLDAFVQKQTPEIRAAAQKAAQPWLDAIRASRS